MKRETAEKIQSDMKTYEDGEFDLYCAEAGWEDWMEEYLSDPDGDDIPESEINDIVEVQLGLWNDVHGDASNDEEE